MHEASLVQGLLKLAVSALNDYNAIHPDKKAGGIREIVCGYGLLACFEPITLRGCFEIFSEETVAAGAELVLKPLPLSCKCKTCHGNFTLESRHFVCPVCGSDEILFTGGHELVLQAINVDCEEDGQ